MTQSESEPAAFPVLTAQEQRLLGCLIEKEATTPESYPLTINALQLAANQKTNREPVMALETGLVAQLARRLCELGLAAPVDGARTVRYRHLIGPRLKLPRPQQALLAMLLLRGPQTVGELLLRCERLGGPQDADELRHQLERLAQRQPALVTNIGREPGQREDRWMHLLGGPVATGILAGSQVGETTTADLQARVEALETEVGKLQARLARLEQALGIAAD